MPSKTKNDRETYQPIIDPDFLKTSSNLGAWKEKYVTEKKQQLSHLMELELRIKANIILEKHLESDHLKTFMRIRIGKD